MKRSPMKRGKPLHRGSSVLHRVRRMPSHSDKRKAENNLRRVVVERMRRDEPWCHARCIEECTNDPTDAHEVLTRARGGSITDAGNMMLVCRPCHIFITDNPRWADEHGFTTHSWEA